jgi:transcriptional regulator with XRE-family HTH domain
VPQPARRKPTISSPTNDPAHVEDLRVQARSGTAPVKTRSGNAGEPRIGSRLKHARLLQGHTLRELADTIQCSESMLSKVENDKLTPSIAFLHRLASALGTSIADLFAESSYPGDPVRIFPADRRARIVENSEAGETAAWFERIAPVDRNGLLQAIILNIPPGTQSDGLVEHVGEEIGYVIEGELELTVDGRSYFVRPGDMVFFPSNLPHGYSNNGDIVCRMLWVNTPPTL